MATRLIPSSLHMEMAHERPRALNEPVGFRPSSFTQRDSAPMRAPSRGVRHIGVQPSPRITTDPAFGGSTGAYRHMLAGPEATSLLGQRWRMTSRSYRTSSGPPQVQRFASAPASYLELHRLHS